jgi:hypothetical protein
MHNSRCLREPQDLDCSDLRQFTSDLTAAVSWSVFTGQTEEAGCEAAKPTERLTHRLNPSRCFASH